MARIRYLKPEFFTDEDIGYLTVKERLGYAGLWCHADREGRLEDRPRYLKTQIFPYDNFDMEGILNSLSQPKKTNHNEPFIVRYSNNGRKYIQILKFLDHQKPHHTEKNSTYPPPKDGELTVKEPLQDGEYPVGSKREVKDKGKGEDKEKYLDFVLLSPQEHSKLIEKFGEAKTNEYIERLNTGIGSKGYKYKSHYFTILNWERRDPKPSPLPKGPKHDCLCGKNGTIQKDNKWYCRSCWEKEWDK